jgi:branched-chain amino acid transport system ATP-binding protein
VRQVDHAQGHLGLVPAHAVRCALPVATSRGSRLPHRAPGLLLPEERRIFTDLTVYENLEVGAKAAVAGASRQPWTAERLFAIFPNLAEMRGRRASQMSGGEQQMLTVPTLMGQAEAVLLDEPSEGLAPVIVEQMAAAVPAHEGGRHRRAAVEQNLHFAAGRMRPHLHHREGAIRHEGRMADIAPTRPTRVLLTV